MIQKKTSESKETEHDDLSSGHQISDRYTNNYIRLLQRWKQEHPDWKQNVDKTLSNFVKYMVKMGYNKRSAEMAWNDYLYSPESKASELTDIEKRKKRLAMQGDGSGMDGNSYGMDEPYRDLDEESLANEAGLEDHSCPECGFITSDNSDYVDHLNAHEE